MTAPVRPTTLGVVPARAGSVRLPRKHLERVGGLTLVERAIEHATRFGIDEVVVTTDDELIIELVAGCDSVVCLRRPPHLATCTASTDSVIEHVLAEIAHDDETIVVLLQPTSPFIDRNTIAECVATARQQPDCLALTVAPLPKPPSWLLARGAHGVLRATALDDSLRCPTGAVYAFTAGSFKAAGGFAEMTKLGVDVASHHAIDVDEPHELVVARALYDAGWGDDLIDR